MTRSVSCFILTIFWMSLLIGSRLPAAAQDDFIVILDQSASMREKTPGDRSAYQQEPLQAPKSREAIKAINEVVTTLLREGITSSSLPLAIRQRSGRARLFAIDTSET